MRTDEQAGRAGALRWRPPRIRLRRPTGIRNGGLLLVLVALAAVMALVDRSPGPEAGRSLPGMFQHLPPPVGIIRVPPVADQPPAPPATGRVAALAGPGERPASSGRAHPNRQHPRPSRSQTSGLGGGNAASRPAGGDSGQGPTGTSRPPVTSPPVEAAPAARVRVPSVAVRVRPPALLGRDLGEARAATPQVTVDATAAQAPRLRLG